MISPHERVACTDEMSPAAVPSRGYPDFARLLGPSAWFRLPAAIRARFPSRHRIGHAVEYAGAMRVRASRFGRLLACLARVFDTPVAPFVGENVDTVVKVYPRPEVEGVVWERTYRFPRRGPAIVRSTKCLGPDGRLIEALGRGLRMQLEVFEDRGALRFVSTGYWIELFGLVVRLPSWLPPRRHARYPHRRRRRMVHVHDVH